MTTPRLGLLLATFAAALLAACVTTPERLVYDRQGVSIGTQHDPTVNRSTPTGRNSHPSQLASEQIRVLLGLLRVSGWSGSLVGMLATPTAIPVFRPEELQTIAEPVSRALASAGPDERVFFILPNRKVPYSDDRIVGALAVRGPYLHVVLTDHSAFIRGDTAGGEDPRDTKGMKLSVAAPARPAQLAESEEPHWGPYEKVHLSLAIQDILALARTSDGAPSEQSVERSRDLQRQVQELATSNLELKKRLEEQSGQMAELKDELQKLKKELKTTRPKSSRTRPSP